MLVARHARMKTVSFMLAAFGLTLASLAVAKTVNLMHDATAVFSRR
jgi:hypothetical protein